MRAVKSVLVMAGNLKRENPDLSEDIVLIRAMRDSNVPKFLADDLVLFFAVIGDLFPGVEVPKIDYGLLENSIKTVILRENMTPSPKFVFKVIQLWEIFKIRFGTMLVGPTNSGKTKN
jgi:dynein heavy chain